MVGLTSWKDPIMWRHLSKSLLIKHRCQSFIYGHRIFDKTNFTHFVSKPLRGLRGATLARLTPDQKVACSNHVGVRFHFHGRSYNSQTIIILGGF